MSGDLLRFLSHCPIPAFVVEPGEAGFVFVLVNPALAAASGWPEEAALGRTPHELFPEPLADQLTQHFRHAWDTPGVVDLTACLPHLDGPRDWDIAIVPVQDAQGAVARLVGYGIDPGEMARRRLAHQTGGQLVLEAIQSQEAMVCRTLPDTTLTFVNAAYARAAGRDPRELLGQRFIDQLPEAERQLVQAHLARLTPAEPVRAYTLGFTAAHGGPLWQRWIDIGAFDAEGRLLELHSVGRDITEIQLALMRAVESENRFQTVVENVAEGVLLTDLSGHILYANPMVSEILGWTNAELLGQPLATVTGAEALSEAAAEGLAAHEMAGRHRDGRPLRLQLRLSEVELEGTRHLIGVLRDNTAIHEAQSRIQRLAYHDELTDLPNQRRLKERLRELMAVPGTPMALLLIDLVDFSALNGAIGFSAGDRVLRGVARRLAGALPPDALLARFGNDRFAVLLPGAVEAEAEALRLAAVIEGAAPESEAEAAGTDRPEGALGFRLPAVTIGIALAPQDDVRPDGLLEAAEIALLDAKQKNPGGARSFAASMRRHASRRFSMAQGLRHALETGGLFIEVQPRFTAATRMLTGGEALVRWRREDGHLVGPAEFVPLAEETGLIRPLTDLVLQQVVALLGRMPGELRISMNVPPTQLLRQDLAAQVGRQLAQQGVPGHRLGIELTESALLGGGQGPLDANLEELRRLGCCIALDDFGTGYSSLSRLRQLPIDELKIDRSFIRDAAADPAGAAFLRAIGAMGEALGLRMVAEGVETEAELAEARAIHCHEVQGWLWGRPMPVVDFLRLGQTPAGVK